MEMEYIILSAAITLVSLILIIVTLHSYRISGNKKLLFVLMVFLFFFIRGAFLSIGLFYEPLAWIATSYYTWAIDLVILTLIYIAALQR
jgi:hypothetical protein